MSTNVYILRCENGKRYVGKSADIQKRFQEHKNGNGSAWTNKHKPLAIERIYKNVSPFDEDKILKEQMSKHGIDNVRGGTYSSVKLSDNQKESLEKEIRGAQDCCLNCGDKNHFARDCMDEDEQDEEDDDEETDEDEDEDDEDEDDEDENDEDEDEDEDEDYYSD
jgi:predicted GIY-YIG superfamily endonuclease